MTPQIIFPLDLALGYVAWLLCFGTYVWPRLREMDSVHAQRAIATLHSFRFIGLVRFAWTKTGTSDECHQNLLRACQSN
jgi:hypothetical protein